MYLIALFQGGRSMIENKALCELCLGLARGDLSHERFGELLLETGVALDDREWETASRMIGLGEQMQAASNYEEATLQ